MAFLVCENLEYLYSMGTPFQTAALDDVSLEIEKGELVGIIGHTGSGKSTLIQHLNGLLEPHKGNVILDGENIWTKENRKKIRQVRFAVGLCFQYPEYQIFEEDVYKEIAFGPKQMGLDEAEIDKRIRKSMEFVGLSFDEFSKNHRLIFPVAKKDVLQSHLLLLWSLRCLFLTSRVPVLTLRAGILYLILLKSIKAKWEILFCLFPILWKTLPSFAKRLLL